jgi:hypothetical protein
MPTDQTPTAAEVEALRVAWAAVAITWQQLRTEAAAGRAYHDARKALEEAKGLTAALSDVG